MSIIESAGVQILLIGVIIIIFLSAVIGWPIAFALRQQHPNHTAGARAAQWFTAVTALLFIFSLATIAAELSGDVYKYPYGVPAKTAFLLQLSYLNAVLVVVMAVFAAISWRKQWWTLAARIHYSAISPSAVALIPILIYWRLLGYGY